LKTKKTTSIFRVGLLMLIFAFFTHTALSATPSERPKAIGIKVQAYPAGIAPAIHGSFPLSDADALHAFAGYNFTDRRDFGKHENEEGGGPGFGLAWRHYFGKDHNGWHIGVRTDLWFLDIDWQDDSVARNGKTEITVLQPTAQGGYTWIFSDGRIAVSATAAFGAEINIKTAGEEVGEGAILLLGVGLGYRF
jgi:hypothetical protein